MNRVGNVLRRTLFGRVTLLRAGLLMLAIFGVLHLLGWRDDTAIISGGTSTTGARWMEIRGVCYGLAYIGATICGPILILAAGLQILFDRLLNVKRESR